MDIEYFRDEGFVTKKCESCGSIFHTRDPDRKTCGDSPCDTYSFIGSPVLKRMKLDEMREYFLSFFEKRGHARVNPYPVIARWRDDVLLTNASIYDFQPWVTSGRVPPPANPLVISQPCIRLDELESVGRSGKHLTAFEMMAHHAFNFLPKRVYWKDETVRYCDELLMELGAPKDGICYKEKMWVGGGNAGPCLEVLVGGLELATLVFMDMELSPDGDVKIGDERYRRMNREIVDTGYGLERFVWASAGTPTIYDAVFPDVVRRIMEMSPREFRLDDSREILERSARVAGMMINIKGRNLEELRRRVAESIGVDVNELKKILEPIETAYALADHTRCIAFMLRDKVIPSNVRAGYLLRLMIRRALRMMGYLEIQAPLMDVVMLHDGVKFDEIDIAAEILDLEEKKYNETIDRGRRLVRRTAEGYGKRGEKVPLSKVIEFYDTHGVPPEIVDEICREVGVDVEIPDDFYSHIARKHEKVERAVEHAERGEPTRKLYYEDPLMGRFTARVIESMDSWIVLDQTAFYPEGGGQPPDDGFILFNGKRSKVVDVQGERVVRHKIEGDIPPAGAEIVGEINFSRRYAHMAHHTATHIILEAAKRVLGSHIWQSGSQLGEDMARLDVSHYKRISDEERERIERIANEIVRSNIPVEVKWMDRNEAERRYGFVLYQGGVPPGDKIRVVIIGENAQACGGTHCISTGMVGCIKIVRTERIQDGIERIEFSAGDAAIRKIQEMERILRDASEAIRVPREMLPKSVERFFKEWKELRKENERLRDELASMMSRELLSSAENVKGMKLVVKEVDVDPEILVKIASKISEGGATAILGCRREGARIVVSSPTDEINAYEIAKEICRIVGGGGGGDSKLAQGGGEKAEKIGEALLKGRELVMSLWSTS